MPVHKVKLPDGSTGYQWGRTGKIYKDPRKAYAQGAAIEHSGWKQKKAQYSIQQPVLVSKLPQQKREAVAKLIQGLQRDMPTITPIQWKRTTVQRILQRLDKDQEQAAIAYHKGQPVAAATGGIDQKSSQAFFNNLYVDQKHRGKGLARRLLQKLEQRAADAGIQRAFLHVTANNPARRLYRQLGYMPQSIALYKQLQKQNDGLSQQRRMLQQVAQTAQTAGLPIFAVTQGASITRNNGSQAVRRARQAHAQYQRSVGDNPDQDWSTQKKAALRQPKSVQDLDKMYDKITYGLVDFQAGKPWRKTHRSTTQQDWADNWRLLTPQQIRKYKAAVCWDAARFNHHVLDKLGIQHRSLFAHSQRDSDVQYNQDPTHSFTVYKGADSKWHWLQGSWQPYKHNKVVADTSDQLIQHVGQLLTKASGQPQHIGQITQWPQYGIGMIDFYKHMLNQVRSNKLLQTAMQEQGTQKKAALNRQQLQQIARPYYTDDKWQHIQDVYRDAQVIKGKKLTPTQAASIIFHDTAKRDMGTAGHAANGAAIAQRQLKQHFPAEQLALICQAIKEHNPAQRIDLDTMKSRIKQFSSPQAQLLAISDDLFPDPSIIQDRALSYMKRRNIENTPQNLAATVRKVYYPGTRMPQLKHYKRQFQLANLPLQAYIDSVYKQ